MSIRSVCQSYFNGFHEATHYKEKKTIQTLISALKIVSYFTLIIPLGFATAYGFANLKERVWDKKQHKDQDTRVHNQALDVIKNNSKTLEEVLSSYDPEFLPKQNLENLKSYSQSNDFQRHAQSARIYYNNRQLEDEDALRVIFQREPTNITMGKNQYNQTQLKKLWCYQKSVYNDKSKKMDGKLFSSLPNTATVYSETYLWNPPGGTKKKEIACLSLPAPALDTSSQPHYKYYVKNGHLIHERYQEEMQFLFKTIEVALRENKNDAFSGKGIKRLVLSRFGQGAFLAALSDADQKAARNIFEKELVSFLENIKDIQIEVVLSEYLQPSTKHYLPTIIGDILQTAKDGDLIINAWDPHSAPGNGNDKDNSFDGAMGKGTGILLTQTSWLNTHLKSKKSLRAVY